MTFFLAIKLQSTRGHVPISDGNYIWTVGLNGRKCDRTCAAGRRRLPLVLLHGFGGGVGLWVKNLAALADGGRPVYAMDLLGFGRSSRKSASGDAQEAEERFIRSLEEWREAVGVDTMILLGHDLGGYVAAAYAIEHPHR